MRFTVQLTYSSPLLNGAQVTNAQGPIFLMKHAHNLDRISCESET